MEMKATYATVWIEEMNRGRLFEINNVTYSLFRMLEMLLHEGEPLVYLRKSFFLKIEEEYKYSISVEFTVCIDTMMMNVPGNS